MGLFGYVYLLVPMTKNAWRMALASNIQKYTFKMAPGPCKQYLVIFSEDLKLSSGSDIYTTWGMAQAGLSGSELGADLSAWLAKIMAWLSGLTAPSRAVYITIRLIKLPFFRNKKALNSALQMSKCSYLGNTALLTCSHDATSIYPASQMQNYRSSNQFFCTFRI